MTAVKFRGIVLAIDPSLPLHQLLDSVCIRLHIRVLLALEVVELRRGSRCPVLRVCCVTRFLALVG